MRGKGSCVGEILVDLRDMGEILSWEEGIYCKRFRGGFWLGVIDMAGGLLGIFGEVGYVVGKGWGIGVVNKFVDKWVEYR